MSRFRFPLLFAGVLIVLAATEALTSVAVGNPVTALLAGFGTAAVSLLAYRWLSRRIEKRSQIDELARPGAVRRLALGVLTGAGAFTAVMMLIAATGGWERMTDGSISGLLVAVGVMACVAVNEELLIRAVLVRILAERFGGWIALIVSSLIFGALHLTNPDATLWGALTIALTGGLMLGAAYLATRSLWLPIGLHFGWNLTESGIFGTATSGAGESTHTLWHTELSGPSLLTGGEFGPEGSVFAVAVCLALAVVLLAVAVRNGGMRTKTVRATAPEQPSFQ